MSAARLLRWRSERAMNGALLSFECSNMGGYGAVQATAFVNAVDVHGFSGSVAACAQAMSEVGPIQVLIVAACFPGMPTILPGAAGNLNLAPNPDLGPTTWILPAGQTLAT